MKLSAVGRGIIELPTLGYVLMPLPTISAQVLLRPHYDPLQQYHQAHACYCTH